jgi:hypothetical protein
LGDFVQKLKIETVHFDEPAVLAPARKLMQLRLRKFVLNGFSGV